MGLADVGPGPPSLGDAWVSWCDGAGELIDQTAPTQKCYLQQGRRRACVGDGRG